MMKFEVEMWAFQLGAIREVEVPEEELWNKPDSDLETIYSLGQNDFQPVAGRCSVSVGDVIRYGTQRFEVDRCGFKEVTDEPKEHNLERWLEGAWLRCRR